MVIKRKISFKTRAIGKDKNIFQIRMRVSFNSQRIDFKTGHSILDLDYWDDSIGLVKDDYKGPKGETALSINNSLRNLRDQMDTAFKYYEAMDIVPTLSQIQKKYEERLSGVIPKRPEPEKKKREQKPKEPNMFIVFDEFTRKCGEKNAWTIATFEKMSALRADLQNFGPKVKLSELDEDALTRFVGYLRDEKKVFPAKKKKDAEEDEEEKRHPKETALIQKVERDIVRKTFVDIEGLRTSVYASLVRYLEEKEYIRWQPFDAAFDTNATLDDLDEEKMHEFIVAARAKRNFPLPENSSPTKLLTHLSLMDEKGRISNSAVLLFGKRPQKFFLTSEMKCVQFFGNVVKKPLPAYQICRGTLFEMIDQATAFVMDRVDLAVGTRSEGNTASVPTDFELPPDAVKEAIVNAVLCKPLHKKGYVKSDIMSSVRFAA